MNLKSSLAGYSSKFTQSRAKSLLLVFTLIFTLIACKGQSSSAQQQQQSAPAPVVAASAGAGANSQGYANLVERVSPAVVTVHAAGRVRVSQRNPLFDDPRFRDFFGDRIPQQPRRTEGLGSGVIVSNDGYILTNNHVVEGASTVRVDLNDRRTVEAKVVGTDPASDLAVLKIEDKNLPALTLADSDKVRVGDVALAIGNPLGIGKTVTSGIVSAKGRSTPGGDSSTYEDFIQTDAPINRGNSGGALINTNGELIGINSQILSPTGGSIGIGFAIPSNMAKTVMDQLVKSGKVRRSVLGVGVQEINSDMAASLQLPDVRGVIVGSVQPGSSAANAGLKVGDVITALNGNTVTDRNTFRNTIAGYAPGTDVTLTVLRDGREQAIRAKLLERTEEAAADEESSAGPSGDSSSTSGKLGISVKPLTPELAGQLRLAAGTEGVVVDDVNQDGPAADAGIRENDVIQQINRQTVRSIADVRNAVQASGTRPILLLVNRGGQTVFLTVRPANQQ